MNINAKRRPNEVLLSRQLQKSHYLKMRDKLTSIVWRILYSKNLLITHLSKFHKILQEINLKSFL